MKNLANCTPREFFTQTVKIKHSVSEWLTVTDIMAIRKRMPALPENMTQPEKKAAIQEQARKNLNDMFNAIMERHPEETLNLLAELCFVEPEHIDDYPMTDYLASLSEMLGNEAVISFFTSLMRLARTGIFKL